MANTETLCWKCARAYPGNGCEWADNFRPVDGWTAEPTLKGGLEPIRSYRVSECPKFVREARRTVSSAGSVPAPKQSRKTTYRSRIAK